MIAPFRTRDAGPQIHYLSLKTTKKSRSEQSERAVALAGFFSVWY